MLGNSPEPYFIIDLPIKQVEPGNSVTILDCLEENNEIPPDESYLNDEIQMIHDFIEFKLFKNVMTKNKIGRK